MLCEIFRDSSRGVWFPADFVFFRQRFSRLEFASGVGHVLLTVALLWQTTEAVIRQGKRVFENRPGAIPGGFKKVEANCDIYGWQTYSHMRHTSHASLAWS